MLFCTALGSTLCSSFLSSISSRGRRWLALLLLGVLGGVATAGGQAKTATTTTLALTVGGNAASTASAGSVVTLTAQVTEKGAARVPGQVNFCDAAAKTCTDIHLLGSAQVTAAGTAALKLRPGLGSHTYKAVFAGTNAYGGSGSGSAALTVSGKAPTAATIAAMGQPGNYTLTATVGGQGGSNAPTGTVSFLDISYGNTSVAVGTLGEGAAGLGFLPSEVDAGDNQSTSVAVGDFNGDGIPDLAVASTFYGKVSILLGKGDGTFAPASGSPITGLFDSNAIITADFNGDGKADLAFKYGSYAGGVAVYLGNGDGTFTQAANSPITTAGDFGIAAAVAAADFNGDGVLDLAVTDNMYVYGTSSVAILLGNGDGTFKPAATPSVNVGSGPMAAAVGDVNGDGFADVVTANFYDGTVTVLLGKGDGSFQQAAGSPVKVGKFPYAAALGDLNGDGKLDVAVVNEDYMSGGPGSVSVLLGNGDGTFTEAQGSPVTVGRSPQAVAVGDFNADGVPDLAVVNSDDDTVTVLLGTGKATFTAAEAGPVSVGSGPGALALGDFTGAGIPDMAVADRGAATATVLMTVTSQATATASGIAPVGNQTHSVVAQYAGDSAYAGTVSNAVALTPGLAPLVMSPAGGSFNAPQTLSLTEAVPGATIGYAGTGALNTAGFVKYTGAIALNFGGTETITAYATETGYNQSDTATGTYTLNLPTAAMPVISPAGGSFAGPQTVTLTDASPNAVIYYTTDGTMPTLSSTIYSGPVTVASSGMIAAMAGAGGYGASAVTTAQFYIQSSQTRTIYTVAGSGFWGYSGDGGPATQASLNEPVNTAVDGAGNLYIADAGNQVVRKVDAATGKIATVAGTGTAGYSGDSGPAGKAQLSSPFGVAVDAAGNLYIADSGNSAIRRVDAATGKISTVAGNGTSAYGGDGGPAGQATLSFPLGIALNAAGDLYIGDGSRVRMVKAGTGTITTVAGNGSYGDSGDGGPATSANLGEAEGVAVDAAGNLYIADRGNNAVRKVTAAAGTITTVAGVGGGFGNAGYSGDGGAATAAKLNQPSGVAVDAAGNLYIADVQNYVVREVTAADGKISTLAGHAGWCATLGGDGGPANEAALCYALSVTADGAGNLYVAETAGARIRKITPPSAPPAQVTAAPVFSVATGTYSAAQTLTMTDATPGAEIYVTVNGKGATAGTQGYSGPIAITGSATIQAPAVAPGYLPSSAVSATYEITTLPAAVINTVAGNGTQALSGAGGPATSTGLGYPGGIAVNAGGDVYVTDTNNMVVWKVSGKTGAISVAAGVPGVSGFGPAEGPATSTPLGYPQQVAVDRSGNLYIADSSLREVFKVDAKTGQMTMFAGGGGNQSVLGDGGPATQAWLIPYALAFDAAGNLYISDTANNRIREVSAATGMITTVAGGGTGGQGDGGPATSARLNYPEFVTLDSKGNLFFAESQGRVRVVDAATHIITTFAGNGNSGATGDGGPATAAEVSAAGLAVDASDNVYLSNGADGVRMVPHGGGTITRVVGVGFPGFGGDGGAAGMAELCGPSGLAFDSAGSLYIADACNYRVREVTYHSAAKPVFSLAGGVYATAQTLTITDATAGATIHYTVDGTIPTAASATYTGALAVATTETVKAVAVATGYTVSEVASADYAIGSTAVATISAVTSSLNPSMTGNPVTFTVQVSSSLGTPSGTVTFFDGTQPFGSATLSGGTATYTTSMLVAGSHSISAAYGGDGTFAAVTSAALSQVVESFSIAPGGGSSTTATVSPGGKATYTLALVAPANGSALTFSVTGLPAGATAVFSPATLAAGSGATNVTLTVALAGSAAVSPMGRPLGKGTWPVALALVLLPWARRARRGGRGWVALVVLGLGMAAGVSGCGGSGQGSTGTTPTAQTYKLTVTAASGTLTQSTTLTLVVQ